MQSVKIRAARADDAAAIRELEHVVVAASLPLVREMLADRAVAEAAGAIVDDALRLVAVANGAAQPDTHVHANGRTHPGERVNANTHGHSGADAHANVHPHGNAHGHSNARIVGMIAVTLRAASPGDSARPHIRALAVAAANRRRGIGLRLLRRAEEWAQEHGFSGIATNVAEGNAAALAFFHRAGYHEDRGVLVKHFGASP